MSILSRKTWRNRAPRGERVSRERREAALEDFFLHEMFVADPCTAMIGVPGDMLHQALDGVPSRSMTRTPCGCEHRDFASAEKHLLVCAPGSLNVDGHGLRPSPRPITEGGPDRCGNDLVQVLPRKRMAREGLDYGEVLQRFRTASSRGAVIHMFFHQWR